MSLVDPVETVIEHLRAQADLNALIVGRVAAKHKFGEVAGSDWAFGAQAMQVWLAGGRPRLNTPEQAVVLEARCYGGSQADAWAVYGALVQVTRDTERTRVQVSAGFALLYYLTVAQAGAFGQDQDTGLDMVTCFLNAMVAEQDIP